MIWAMKSEGPVRPAAFDVRTKREPPTFKPIIKKIKTIKPSSFLNVP
jgi:hypothetical protein